MPLPLTAIALAIAAPAPVTEARPACDRITPSFARQAPGVSPGDARTKRLGELPPANVVLALYRSVDGCNAPIVVHYGIGANGK